MGSAVASSAALPVLGIIAGGGVAPAQLIAACRRMGRSFFVVCLEGHADRDLPGDAPHAWLPLGALAKLKDIVAQQAIGEIVLLGRVRRPSLLELKPDWLAMKTLARIGLNVLGDDALLRSVGKVLEEETGARLIGAQDIFADMLTPAGVMGALTPDEQAQSDIHRALEVVRCLGLADVGQAVVVQQGLVLGVEAIEGTDALLARCATLRREGVGGVLVKMAKPKQDNRFDLPTIGLETVRSCQAAGLRGIALEAGRSLCLNRDDVIAAADAAGIFIVGVEPAVAE